MPRLLAAKPDARFLVLPWHLPLSDWPTEHLVALPRGISRHVVRFIKVGKRVYAAKELLEPLAVHEYRMLTELTRLGEPAVRPVAVVTGRQTTDGRELDPVLITRHLKFSLPYRSLFSAGVRPDTVSRLLSAMVLLLARLHIVGFVWRDVSLSNILFRRDAGEFAAYLVDAETSELHETLSDGQREQDLEVAMINLLGEFLDLQAGGLLDESLDPVSLVESIEEKYRELWAELTGVEEFADTEMHRIESRVRRLNDLGFDVEEWEIKADGSRIRIQPKVVDAGHNSRRLMRLTGLDAEENQARRLLADLEAFRVQNKLQGLDESIAAHEWLTYCFAPVVAAVPKELMEKRDPAQVYHEVLDYRWYQSERENRSVPLTEAVQGYIDEVLVGLPDELLASEALCPVTDGRQLVNPYDPSFGYVEDEDEPAPYDPWEDDEPPSGS